jgi:hypothetical protein
MVKKRDEAHGLPSLSIVLGYIAVKELKSIEDKVKILDKLGYGNEEMAIICGTTPPSIRAARSKIKKERVK